MDNTPLVTLALPLYHSRRFLDIITANLDSITYPNLRVLISDRHCADNAIDVLEARYGADPRFRFLRARDEINWVAHYNALLLAGTGRYFLWMPHDDTYPENYITALVNTLERAPDAVAAYGDMKAIWRDGTPGWVRARCHFSTDELWTWRSGMALFLHGDLCLVMRGLFRREMLLEKGLFLVPTRETNASDLVWLYAIACSGRMVWTPDTWCQKRFYAESTHARWRPRTWRHTLSEIPALRATLVDNQPSVGRRVRGLFLVGLWAALRLGRNGLDATDARHGLEPRIRRLLLSFVHPARG